LGKVVTKKEGETESVGFWGGGKKCRRKDLPTTLPEGNKDHRDPCGLKKKKGIRKTEVDNRAGIYKGAKKGGIGPTALEKEWGGERNGGRASERWEQGKIHPGLTDSLGQAGCQRSGRDRCRGGTKNYLAKKIIIGIKSRGE